MHIASVSPVPTRLLCFQCSDGEWVPAWLSDRDRPWLRDLLTDSRVFAGHPMTELLQRWRASDRDPRAGSRQAIALHVLSRWLRGSSRGPTRTHMRRQLFDLAAAGVERQRALEQIASQHELSAKQLADTLFHDLPGNRVVSWPDSPIEPAMLCLHANQALVRGMLRHAQHAEILLHGGSRSLLRTAWLLGLRIEVATTTTEVTRLTWRRQPEGANRKALDGLVPLLPWTHRYRLRATCTIDDNQGELVLTTGDPLQPGPEPRMYDSKLERSFAADFARAKPNWQIVREPTAIHTSHGLAFPDFAMHARNGRPGWLCEVSGLRDPKALPAKLALLDAHPRLILCLPRRLLTAELRSHARIVPFGRKVPIDAVIAVMQR